MTKKKCTYRLLFIYVYYTCHRYVTALTSTHRSTNPPCNPVGSSDLCNSSPSIPACPDRCQCKCSFPCRGRTDKWCTVDNPLKIVKHPVSLPLPGRSPVFQREECSKKRKVAVQIYCIDRVKRIAYSFSF